MDQIDFSEFFKTQVEAKDFSSRLSTISEMIFQADFDINRVLTDTLGLKKKEKFLALLRDNSINTESKESLKDFLKQLQDKVSSIPVLSVVLAFDAREESLQVITQWFFINMKKQMLLDVKIDKKLVAGAAIYYSGKYLDYSIKSKFEEVLKKVLETKNEPINEEKVVPAAPVQAEFLALGRH